MPTYKIQVLNNFKPDWNQTDETQADYIKNKPTLGTLAEKDSEIYIGSGEMPEGYIMQIDPDGTSSSILPDVTEADNGKVLRVVDGVWSTDEIPAVSGGSVNDVQVNGTTIVTDGIANIPVVSDEISGLCKTNRNYGIISKDGYVALKEPNENELNLRDSWSWSKYNTVTLSKLDYAVKAAMCDGKGAAWTTEEQAMAKARMGINNWDTILSEVALDTETVKYILCSCDEYDRIEIIIKRESNNTSLTGNMNFGIADSSGNLIELYTNNSPGYREKLTIMEVNNGYAHSMAMTMNNLYSGGTALSRSYYVGEGCNYYLIIPKPNTACDGLSRMTVIGRRR